jgi:hypothetical protein
MRIPVLTTSHPAKGRARIRRLARSLGGVAAIAIAAGCGGKSLEASDAGSRAPNQEHHNTETEDASAEAQSRGESSDSSEGTTSEPAFTDDAGDAGCSQNVLTYQLTNTTFTSCWACLKQYCSTQFAACATDCSCNEIFAAALRCTDADEEGIESCLSAAAFSAWGPATEGVVDCWPQYASGACNCDTAVPVSPMEMPLAPDASMGCTFGYGGEQAGGPNGCENTMSETCNGTQYIVSCSCPEGACVCFGPTTHIVAYPGCPSCPTVPAVGSETVDDVFALCGFPPYLYQN